MHSNEVLIPPSNDKNDENVEGFSEVVVIENIVVMLYLKKNSFFYVLMCRSRVATMRGKIRKKLEEYHLDLPWGHILQHIPLCMRACRLDKHISEKIPIEQDELVNEEHHVEVSK